MSFEMLATSQKWQDIKEPENIYECNGRYYTALNADSIVYNGDIVSVTLVETWYLLKKVFLQAHNVDTKIEALDEHTIKILPKTAKTLKLTVNGIAYDDNQVTDIKGNLLPRGSAGYALWAILKGTDWKLGICDVLPKGFDASKDYGTFNVESDMKSALENIQFIQQMYGGILDWDSKNKILNLRDETKDSDFNAWKGYEIRKNKNLENPPQIVWDNDIITRAYPLGNGNLNIRRVNNNKSYIDNFSYTNSIYEGYIRNENIYHTNDEAGQKTLKFWAEKELEKLCKPRKIINYEILDLRATQGHEFETFDINDIVRAYYVDDKTGKEKYEYVRVQHISYNYFFPTNDSTIEVGDKVANERELFYQIFKTQKNSAPTDNNGHLSADDVFIKIDEEQGFIYDSLTDAYSIQSQKIIETETSLTTSIANLKVYSDETFATIESFTAFENQTNDKFEQSQTSITQLSNELTAQINLEASHYSETQSQFTQTNATITQEANRLEGKISLQAGYIDDLERNVAKIEIKADENSSQILLQADEIKLKASKTYVDGLVSNYATIAQLNATNARINSLDVKNLTLNGQSVTWKNISLSGVTWGRKIKLVESVDFAKKRVEYSDYFFPIKGVIDYELTCVGSVTESTPAL